MLERRYSEVLEYLSNELGVEMYPQKFEHWCRCLKVTGRDGWYDTEDIVGLVALGEAFVRHRYRGKKAVQHAIQRIEQWRLTQTN